MSMNKLTIAGIKPNVITDGNSLENLRRSKTDASRFHRVSRRDMVIAKRYVTL